LPAPPARDITQLLVAWCAGDRAALGRLVPLIYAELRVVAHRQLRAERRPHDLQTTALVNEAYLRLVDIHGVRWQNRAQFFAISAQIIRHILVDAARERGARKRGGDVSHIRLEEAIVPAPERGADLVALDTALTLLCRIDPRKARVVELRYFGGLSVEEAAEVLAVSADTVMRDWRMAKLWLRREVRRTGARPRSRPS
jgi:RNA polymerase sigma-70 factor (ECF subfamily)